jgi:phosphoglycerate kinase
MKIRTIREIKRLKGKRVLLRVDFNIPLGAGGAIAQQADAKMRAALPTVELLARAGAKVILVTHLGRPKKCERKFSLAPVAAHLAVLLGRPVRFVDDCLEEDLDAVVAKLAPLGDGEVAMLENVRFYPGEERNDPKLARALASLADVFVNDAFAAAHRAHASTVCVTRCLPAYAGLLMEAELKNLGRLLVRPARPFVVVMGGAKISTKMPTLRKLLSVADRVLVGGGMANNFLRAWRLSVGKSLVSPEDVKLAKALLKDRKISLPTDVLAATSLKESARVRYCRATEVKAGEYIVDVGPETLRSWSAIVKGARTVVWNGPLGLFEVKKFSHGSVALGRVIASRAKGPAFGVIGGGETIQCAERTGMMEWYDHVSTGGGAMLEFLSGKTLPGVKPLIKR